MIEGMNSTIIKQKIDLPLLPLRDLVVFPNMVVPLLISRKKSINSVELALRSGRGLLCVSQIDATHDDPKVADLYSMGVMVRVPQAIKLPDGNYKILVEGVCRASLETLNVTSSFWEAQAAVYGESLEDGEDGSLSKVLIARFTRYAKYTDNISEDVVNSLQNVCDAGRLCDLITLHLPIDIARKQDILDTVVVSTRIEKVVLLLQQEIEWMKVDQRIHSRVKQRISQEQEKYFKHQKLRAIQEELGEGESDPHQQDFLELEKRLGKMTLPVLVKEKVASELKKLKATPPMSAEATVIRMYLEWVADLPWTKRAKINTNLRKAEQVLSGEHYALDKVKDRIVESLAVQLRVKKTKGPVLCLVGPPGVGKTSLGKSVAKAVGRPFLRISLGGVRDESEIRGHRKTYIGAMPGRILKAMKRAKVMNPLIMLDELDKMGMDYRGDPASALLEVLDPEQNKQFSDHYLEVDYDLSDVLFLATANTLDLPAPLMDRMEVIRLSGYTEKEKHEIACKHLMPKSLKENGVKSDELQISGSAIVDIIRRYTREAGVRSLARHLDKICRKHVREVLSSKKKSTRITVQNLKKYLGVNPFEQTKKGERNYIGRIQGLAWTSVGGEMLTVEVVTYPGKGTLVQTGSLGEVIKESMQAALSVVRANALSYGVKADYFTKHDVHIHMPEGATPKDGPSAGIGICSALLSAVLRRPIRHDVAVTGEVTLNGEVLAIGGLKEKLLAAVQAGLTEVVIPYENKKDLDELPKSVKTSLVIHMVKTIQEVFTRVLVPVSTAGQFVRKKSPVQADELLSS